MSSKTQASLNLNFNPAIVSFYDCENHSFFVPLGNFFHLGVVYMILLEDFPK